MERLYPVPGLEKHPDLVRQYQAAVTRKRCTKCEVAAINAKFSELVQKRERRRR